MAGFYNRQEKGKNISILFGGLPITSAVTSIDFTGAGQTTTGVGSDITVDIPGGGGNLSTEIPTGAIDSSNTIFTVVNVPVFIELNGAIQTDSGVDYTLSGAGPYTITFVTPPQTGSILRNYFAA